MKSVNFIYIIYYKGFKYMSKNISKLYNYSYFSYSSLGGIDMGIDI